MSDQPFDQYDSTRSTTDVAKEESKNLGSAAKENAGSVAQTAGTEAKQVAGEAKAQAASLYQQVREDVTGQAKDQQQRAAGGLHGLAGELQQMADGTEEGGMAAGLARQAAERVDTVAGWLEDREPADLLEEVRRYARRNPGTFLAACAAVGFIGGRLTRGLRDESQDDVSASGRQALPPGPTAPAPPYGGAAGVQGYGGRPAAGQPATTSAAAGAPPVAAAGGTAPVVAGADDLAYAEAGEGHAGPGAVDPVDPATGDVVAGDAFDEEPFAADPLVGDPLAGDPLSPSTDGGDRR